MLALSQIAFAIDSKVMPMISSNPNSGTSLGVLNTNIYNTDESSSPSQLMFIAQYSNTDSWSVIGMNIAWLKGDMFKSSTVGGYAYNNSQLYITDIGGIELGEKIDASFGVGVFFAYSQLLYKTFDNFYLGGQISYVDTQMEANDVAGELFLKQKGMEDTKSSSFGINADYDTRNKTEKHYPRDSALVGININFYLKDLGNEEDFFISEINARVYQHGFKATDVWANQFYGKYASENTPDTSLPALGFRSILRGFSTGQFKTRYLSSYQSEYRYQLDGTKFRFAAFGGIASLNGGSTGNEYGNRDADNGVYASGGLGVRYAIQEEAGVDYRVDFAYTSTDDYGIYATVNQAF
jgi:hypothetical protein